MKNYSNGVLISLDQKVLLTLQRMRRPWASHFFKALTATGTGKAWFLFALMMNILHQAGFQVMKYQIGFMNALFGPLLAWILGTMLKRLFSRKRPSAAIRGFEKIINPPSCGSFPSSHAAASVAFASGLILIAHPLAVIVTIWAVLISFSRLYLGVHYLSDVVGGGMLGIASSYVFMLYI